MFEQNQHKLRTISMGQQIGNTFSGHLGLAIVQNNRNLGQNDRRKKYFNTKTVS